MQIRLLAFLLVFCQAHGPLRAAAPSVTQYVSLLITPSGQLTEGMPMNLTCRFTQLLPSFVVLSMVSYTGLASQLSASTAALSNGSEKLGARISAIRSDDFSMVFAFNYTLVVDGGVYACGASTLLSNAVTVTISSSAVSSTMPASIQHFTAPIDTLTFAVSVTVSLICCFTALIVALVLRFRYGYRFRGSIYVRRSSRRTNRANATNSAQPNNDPDQLPTYENATSMGFDKSYLPPSYYEATSSQAQAEAAQVNVHVVPTVSATPNVAFAADSAFGSHTNPTYSPDNL